MSDPKPTQRPQVTQLEPELFWTGRRFERNQTLTVNRDGEILIEGERASSADSAKPLQASLGLPGRALLPGFVNAHSHAFQIGLRGHGEVYPQERGSFWTWREAMYDLVGEMTPDRLYELSRRAFDEMLAAGITCVGEFHYLRHLSDSGLDFGGDDCVLAAAEDSGIRIVLLAVYYETGAIGQPLDARQRRFETPGLASYWQQMDRLASLLRGPKQSLGVAPHSIRGVPRETLAELYAEARRQNLPVHMHLEEQRREIEECRAAWGQTPMEIVLDLAGRDGDLRNFTAVHCTHTPAEQLRRFFDLGGRACICPLTEGNLGDGLPQLAEIENVEQHLCLGTDSNLRISMLEEMRWLEYGQRVRREERGSIAGDNGTHLLRIATRGGAESLSPQGAGSLNRAPITMETTTVAESTWVYSVGEDAFL